VPALASALPSVFAEEGAHVFITGRRESELDRPSRDRRNAAAVQSDISNLSDLDRIYTTIKDKAGISTCWRSTPGITHSGRSARYEEHFDRTFNTNVRGLLAVPERGSLDRRRARWDLTGLASLNRATPPLGIQAAAHHWY